MQRKKNHDKEENKGEILIKNEQLKREEELKRQGELKKEEELKRKEESKGQEEHKIQEVLEEEGEIKNNGFYYICRYDNKIFSTLKLYKEHYRKEHSSIYSIFGKEFASKFVLQSHCNSKIINNKNFKCKICGKAFAEINALKNHCKDKKH